MRVFTLGLDPLTVNAMKEEGYQTVIQKQLPQSDQVKDQVFIITSEYWPENKLNELRVEYEDAIIFYHYFKKGIRGYQQIHLLCESLNIHFISSMATVKTYIDKLRLIFEDDVDQESKVIGFFGSGPGVGCTSVAATFANKLSASGAKVVMLGLNLFDPGWNQSAAISLDQWRQKLTGKIIQNDDFEKLQQIEGFSYLPGNFDYISAMDYQEHEIEYLLEKGQEQADIVVADFGAIPQSAAWYIGMQWSGIRYFVTKTQHRTRMINLLEVVNHLDLNPADFSLVINRSNADDTVDPKTLQQELAIPQMIEIPKGEVSQLSISLAKKDQQIIEQHVTHLLTVLGIENSEQVEKKRRFFGG